MKNKYQEALDNVMKDNPKAKLTISDIHKDIRLLLELVLKETPMKIVCKKSFGLYRPHCPKCDKVIYNMYDYCFNCGQKLDWSDE